MIISVSIYIYMSRRHLRPRLHSDYLASSVTALSIRLAMHTYVFIRKHIHTYNLQVQFTNYLQIHFYMVLIITEVLFEACFSEVLKLPN